jgi:hypothetical protein
MHQQITLLNKPVIYMVTSCIFAALIYSSTAIFVVFAQESSSTIDCKEANFFFETCHWWNDFGDYVSYVCQVCWDKDGDFRNGYEDCDPPVKTDPRDV